MKKVLIGMIAFFCLLIVGLGVVMGLGIAGGRVGGFDMKSLAKLANRQVFSAEDWSRLAVEYEDMSLELLPSATGEVVLEEYMSSWDAGMLARVEQHEGRLGIRQGERRLHFGLWIGYVKLYLPEDWAGELRLGNGSGSIRTGQDWRLESLQAATTSGALRLAGIRARQEVRLESSSGGIQVDSLQTEGDVYGATTSGALRLLRVEAGGRVRMASSSGGVAGERIQAQGPVELQSTSGSIRIGQVEGESLEAESSSGAIDVEGAAAETLRARNKSGGIRFGKLEGKFDLSCNSGGIRVESGGGSGEARASSGGVRLALQRVDGDLRAVTTSGGLQLSVPSETGFQFSGRTTSGALRTDFDGDLSFNKKGNEATGRYGDGSGYSLACETSSGSLRVGWS